MKLNWGHGIVIFFGIFLTLAAVFIVFAFRHKNDLVTKNYYEKGANYSEQMAIDKRSVLFKDSITVKRTATEIVFHFKPSLINPADSMHIHFFRPSDKALDYYVDIALDTIVVNLDKSIFAQGRYEVKMNWTMGGEAYYLKKDLQIK
jgi:hypothetical protein